MKNVNDFMEKLKIHGTGRKKLNDLSFNNEKSPIRLGVYETDDENLCHNVMKVTCNIPGCKFSAESLLEFEGHYNSLHRHSCAQCKKNLPSAHFLDLHLQENHDSFFAVMAQKTPSYCCYIEECKDKFMTANERYNHCIVVHKIPKDFRFEKKAKDRKKPKEYNKVHMDVDSTDEAKYSKITLSNSRQKTFSKYTGRHFTPNDDKKSKRINAMDISVNELKESLPD